MMEFECPECGWGLTGGDETGVSITSPYGLHDYGIPPADECRFRYCFHCGVKIPEPDSLEKLRDEMRGYAEGSVSCIEEDVLMFADRLAALIERGA